MYFVRRTSGRYTQRPDRKGTERIKDLIEADIIKYGYTQRPDRKGTESFLVTIAATM